MNKTTQNGTSPGSLLKDIERAGRIVETRLDSALGAHGLSIAKQGVLGELVHSSEPVQLGQLAERLACVKSNITQLVDRLEADGLVVRTPDSDDRRSMRAVITEEGRRRYELGKEIEDQVERELTRSLSPDEQVQVVAVLRKFS